MITHRVIWRIALYLLACATLVVSVACADATPDLVAVNLRGATLHGGRFTYSNNAGWRINTERIEVTVKQARCLSESGQVAKLDDFESGLQDISTSQGLVLGHIPTEEAVQYTLLSLVFGADAENVEDDTADAGALRIIGSAIKEDRTIRFDIHVPLVADLIVGPLEILAHDPTRTEGGTNRIVVELMVTDCLMWLDFDEMPTDADGVAYLPYSFWQSEFARNALMQPDNYLVYWSD